MSEDTATRRLEYPAARAFCYILGPFSAALILLLRRYNVVWSVRFHAVHSVLITVVWGMAWNALRALERTFPWFLSVVTRELRMTMNLAFVLVWVGLLITAYRGSRCAAIPFVHQLAVRLARRFER